MTTGEDVIDNQKFSSLGKTEVLRNTHLGSATGTFVTHSKHTAPRMGSGHALNTGKSSTPPPPSVASCPLGRRKTSTTPSHTADANGRSAAYLVGGEIK